MSDTNRRTFLRTSAATITATAALSAAQRGRGKSASEKLTVGVIGCGGQGRNHIRSLRSLKNLNVAYVCDPDQGRLGKAVKESDGSAKPVGDLRRILDDKDIDAVTIATPDHWHAPAALLAMEAGKHVYVEKPCAHNLREGRLLVDAAKRYQRHVQHGTQSRSAAFIKNAVQMLHQGVIGRVLVAKVWNIQYRGNIGKAKPGKAPAGFDYDMWLGPTPKIPWQSNRHHYNWHWWHAFGTGDMGNDGVYDIDYGCWGLGVDTLPSHIAASGGKYFHDDDQQFPDTQTVTFQWPGSGAPGSDGSARQLIYEMRLWSTNYPHGVDSGVEFYGTKGMMFLSKRGKVEILGHRNRSTDTKVEGRRSVSVPENLQNFADTIRDRAKLNAPITAGYLSAGLVHLGNLATRIGRSLRFDPKKEQIIGDDQASKLLTRPYRQGGHWAIPKQS